MNPYVCIHGHFYQPPRENPWLEAVEVQDSAYPYHDWNERITAECYQPNGQARILDAQGWIERINNNYAHISFNFGPTLLSWMQEHASEAYQAILDADRQSIELNGGHGSAIAQAYNHMIMPLASDRDRRTQVLWGIKDFEHRFGRRPEGMWLPETAANSASLDELARQRIAFTILAPRQALRYRKIGSDHWIDARELGIDPRRPYLCRLEDGRSITLFFYDGPLSQAVAFERLLANGEQFASRLLGGIDAGRKEAQLVHIATDGESYGHHHPYGDMALSYAVRRIMTGNEATLVNYGRFLELHPPEWEAEIIEDSSWSCVHGVGRWREDCGCHTGGRPSWNQAWRGPLRDALDWLRDQIAERFEREAGTLLIDPWAARDGYIDVILDRSRENVIEFIERHAGPHEGPLDYTRILRLLEMQRNAMLMYTSCGWFFDELTGIETVQVLQYAGRVIQIAEGLFEEGFEEAFLDRLSKAQSNLPEHGDGRQVYLKMVRPAKVDLLKMAEHYAVISLFEETAEANRVYCYDVRSDERHEMSAGRTRLRVGRATLTSQISLNSQQVTYAVLHLADHIITGGAGLDVSDEAMRAFIGEAQQAFDMAQYGKLLRLIERDFGSTTFSLASLFKDEQRRVAEEVLHGALDNAEATYRRMYDDQAPLLHFLHALKIPAPRALYFPVELVLNADLVRILRDEHPDVGRARQILQKAEQAGVELDESTLSYVAEAALARLSERLLDSPWDVDALQAIGSLVEMMHSAPFAVRLDVAQNAIYRLLQEREGVVASGRLPDAAGWTADAERIASLLKIRS
ncbi:MAG: DUF3536 domain-containing protein [Phycisphaerales bacterium JB060]